MKKKKRKSFFEQLEKTLVLEKFATIRAHPNLYPNFIRTSVELSESLGNLQRFPRAETRNCMLISRFQLYPREKRYIFPGQQREYIDRRLILEFFSFSNCGGFWMGTFSPLFEARWIVGQPFQVPFDFERGGSLQILWSLGFPAIPSISRGFVLSLTVSPQLFQDPWISQRFGPFRGTTENEFN